jgi:hypothetical protein
VAAAAVVTFNVDPGANAGEPSTPAKSSKNAALFTSPRYLEAHPELLRARSSGGESPALNSERIAALTKNAALANSPRFREAHPELRWSSSTEQLAKRSVNRSERWSALMSHKALASSPRFREQHPELLRGQPVFEIAPLK